MYIPISIRLDILSTSNQNYFAISRNLRNSLHTSIDIRFAVKSNIKEIMLININIDGANNELLLRTLTRLVSNCQQL